jgi:hypothetical protein
MRSTNLKIGNMDDITILIFGDNSDDSRPTTPHVVTAVQHFAVGRIHI